MTPLPMWLLLGTFVAVNCGDLSGSALTRLYNTGVQFAELVTRPKQGIPTCVPRWYLTTHSGVLVTLVGGQKFLIHKGPGFGVASDTVVTDAAHMSDSWEVEETRYYGGTKTVGDFVQTGGENYSIMRNCHTAAEGMMNQGK